MFPYRGPHIWDRECCVYSRRELKKKKKRLTHIHTLPSVKTSGRSTKTHTHTGLVKRRPANTSSLT